ncbi:MAG: hypothetical protein H0T07_03575 [Actinobacteria bacterium]|nr:hypothetical protein [Actinomycetota bacterium]
MPATQTFESFFEDEKDRLLRVLSVITGSRVEAEDIAQEAFTRVFERWDSVGVMEDPTAYLYRTAMNGFRSEYRRAARAVKRAVGVGPAVDVFQAVEDRELAAQALARLTPRQRAACWKSPRIGCHERGRDARAMRRYRR